MELDKAKEWGCFTGWLLQGKLLRDSKAKKQNQITCSSPSPTLQASLSTVLPIPTEQYL
jgi:hypothetical protein